MINEKDFDRWVAELYPGILNLPMARMKSAWIAAIDSVNFEDSNISNELLDKNGPGNIKIGSFTIGRYDEDYISITPEYGPTMKITGGDFESILSGLCGVERIE